MTNLGKAKRVTLQDIANHTGYTVNTVSRALKDKSDISLATREYIQKVANEMGYIRNVAASSMRSGRTKTFGVIVGGLSNPYYSIMSDSIYNAATEYGYSLLIQCSRDRTDLELKATEALLSRQVDGILLFPSNNPAPSIARMQAVGVPFVLMARYPEGIEADCVVCDEAEGAYLATRHLLEAGCKSLAYLSSFDVMFSSSQRCKGFLRACAEANAPAKTAFCPQKDEILSQLLRWKDEGVDGLFSFCDDEAWNVVSVLNSRGLSVPGDLALIGFDNIQGVVPFPSHLCSVEYNLSGMAKSGIDLLRRRIHGDDAPAQFIVHKPHVVCRGSCGKA